MEQVMASQRKRTMRWRAVEFAAKRGFFVTRRTDLPRLRDFIESLHPVTTDRELIRLGSASDGGYLVPDDLDGIVACFSPGVGKSADFEAAVASRGIPCYLADASVEKPPISGPLIHFDRKFVGVFEDDRSTTMDRWVKRHAPPAGDLLLQMDIEGAEFACLLNVSEEVLSRFRIIVVELHHLNRLADPVGLDFISASLNRLLAFFHVVHIHPNNLVLPMRVDGLPVPIGLEVTLLRRDRGQVTGYATQFPHPLDRPNLPRIADFPLPDEWHKGAAN
jgi:Methyltransferase FkbM domain